MLRVKAGFDPPFSLARILHSINKTKSMANNYSVRYMLKIALLSVIMMVLMMPSYALIAPSSTPAPSTENATLSKMSVDDFLKLSPKKYRELTGEKLSLTQKLSLKLAQKELKKAIKTKAFVDESIKSTAIDTSDFNLGGFILGLLLSVVGVLIAYLINDSTVIKWAWIGFGISAIIWLLAIIL